MPRLLIDTYNVLHVTGILPPDLAGVDAQGLARLIARSRYASRDAALICDGQAPPDAPSAVDGVRLVYAGAGADADSLIDSLVREDSAPRSLTVVSSDRRVQASGRRRRAVVLSAEQFLRNLAADAHRPDAPTKGGAKPPAPLAPGLIHDWLVEFGYDARAVLASAGRARPLGKPAPAKDGARDGAREQRPAERASGLPHAEEPVVSDEVRRWAQGVDPSSIDMSRIVPDAIPLRRKER